MFFFSIFPFRKISFCISLLRSETPRRKRFQDSLVRPHSHGRPEPRSIFLGSYSTHLRSELHRPVNINIVLNSFTRDDYHQLWLTFSAANFFSKREKESERTRAPISRMIYNLHATAFLTNARRLPAENAAILNDGIHFDTRCAMHRRAWSIRVQRSAQKRASYN